MTVNYSKPEPTPVPNSRDPLIHKVISDVQSIRDRTVTVPMAALVAWDLDDRGAFGFLKYGTYLQARNGRDFRVDIYQESMDKAVYLRGWLEEVEEDFYRVYGGGGKPLQGERGGRVDLPVPAPGPEQMYAARDLAKTVRTMYWDELRFLVNLRGLLP